MPTVLSAKQKYFFLANPHTGSTAIGRELCEDYDAKPILNTHATYFEFKKIASEKKKQYFIFSGVRNPLDEAFSIYSIYLENHGSRFTDKNIVLKYGGYIPKRSIMISDFLQ